MVESASGCIWMAETDLSELAQLTRDLGEAPEKAGPFLVSALKFTAVNIKKDAAKSVGQSTHWKAAAGAIDFDVDAIASNAGSSLTVEVGYNKDKPAGALGNLREFGAPDATYGGKSAPLAPSNDLLLALEANEADFEHGIDLAIDDALGAIGL